MSGGLPPGLGWEKMVFIQQVEHISTWLKLAWGNDIPNPVILLLPLAVPVAVVARLLVSFRWILC
jgi:hypothetical protein